MMAVESVDGRTPQRTATANRENSSTVLPSLWKAKDFTIADSHRNFPEPKASEFDPLFSIKKTDAQKSQVVRSATAAAVAPLISNPEADDPLSRMAAQQVNLTRSPSSIADPLGATSLSSSTPLVGSTNSSSRHSTITAQSAVQLSSNGFENSMEEAIGVSNSESFVPWSIKRLEILEKFTTTEKLNIDIDGIPKAVTVKNSAVEEKIARRLDQLEEMAETGMTGGKDLSQREYIAKIDEMNSGFIAAWNNEEKVKAFKIVIQCIKLLVDTSVAEFYPSKFVLVTDIVETFGKSVYQRMLSKSAFLPDNFTPDMVPESVKELSRNWFYKIYSVREMLPRLYAETAVLKCYRFLTVGEYKSALARITKMIRGIGDPLVAIYTRAYLCRACLQLAPEYRDCLADNFNDFLLCLDQLKPPLVNSIALGCKLELPAYYQLFIPAAEWLIQCVTCNASRSTLNAIREKCEDHIVLKHAVFSTYPPEYVCDNLSYFTEFISEDSSDLESKPIVRKSELYRILGEKCLHGQIASMDEKWELLSGVWKAVLKLDNVQEFMRVANVWLEFSAKSLTPQHVELILKGLIKHVVADRKYEKVLSELTDSVRGMFRQSTRSTCVKLLSLENFLALLDLFQSDQSKRFEVNHMVLELFISNASLEEPCSDPVVVNALLRIGKNLHDNLSSFSMKSVTNLARELAENGQGLGGSSHTTGVVSDLILKMFDRITFTDDFEAQLNFYVEARGSFFLLECVMVELVHRVNALCMETLRRVPSGRHNKRTSAFIRACIAFSIITVPSVENILARLTLYLNTAQVALFNCSTAQADSLFDLLIKTIKHVPATVPDTSAVVNTSGSTHRPHQGNRSKSTEPWMVSFSANLFSSLLMMPDYPSQGILFHFKNAIQEFAQYPFQTDTITKFSIFINAVKALSSFAQQSDWPLKVPYVDNNGDLYGHGADKKYQAELNRIGAFLIGEIDAELNGSSATSVALVIEYLRTLFLYCPINVPFVVKTCEKYIPTVVPKCTFKEKQQIRSLLNMARRELKSEDDSSQETMVANASYRKLMSIIPDTK